MPTSQSVQQVVCIGAGGHAGVVIDAFEAAGRYTIAGLVDADETRSGAVVGGHGVLGDESVLDELPHRGVTGFIVGFDGVGQAKARARAFERALAAGLEPISVIHPSATISPAATIGRGVAVMARAVVNPGASIGDNVILNTGCIVEHDCSIGAHGHIAPAAVILGEVRIGDGAHVGAGAVIHEGLAIGQYAVVGAGAVVIRDVEAGQTVMGVPATQRGRR